MAEKKDININIKQAIQQQAAQQQTSLRQPVSAQQTAINSSIDTKKINEIPKTLNDVINKLEQLKTVNTANTKELSDKIGLLVDQYKKSQQSKQEEPKGKQQNNNEFNYEEFSKQIKKILDDFSKNCSQIKNQLSVNSKQFNENMSQLNSVLSILNNKLNNQLSENSSSQNQSKINESVETLQKTVSDSNSSDSQNKIDKTDIQSIKNELNNIKQLFQNMKLTVPEQLQTAIKNLQNKEQQQSNGYNIKSQIKIITQAVKKQLQLSLNVNVNSEKQNNDITQFVEAINKQSELISQKFDQLKQSIGTINIKNEKQPDIIEKSTGKQEQISSQIKNIIPEQIPQQSEQQIQAENIKQQIDIDIHKSVDKNTDTSAVQAKTQQNKKTIDIQISSFQKSNPQTQKNNVKQTESENPIDKILAEIQKLEKNIQNIKTNLNINITLAEHKSNNQTNNVQTKQTAQIQKTTEENNFTETEKSSTKETEIKPIVMHVNTNKNNTLQPEQKQKQKKSQAISPINIKKPENVKSDISSNIIYPDRTQQLAELKRIADNTQLIKSINSNKATVINQAAEKDVKLQNNISENPVKTIQENNKPVETLHSDTNIISDNSIITQNTDSENKTKENIPENNIQPVKDRTNQSQPNNSIPVKNQTIRQDQTNLNALVNEKNNIQPESVTTAQTENNNAVSVSVNPAENNSQMKIQPETGQTASVNQYTSDKQENRKSASGISVQKQNTVQAASQPNNNGLQQDIVKKAQIDNDIQLENKSIKQSFDKAKDGKNVRKLLNDSQFKKLCESNSIQDIDKALSMIEQQVNRIQPFMESQQVFQQAILQANILYEISNQLTLKKQDIQEYEKIQGKIKQYNRKTEETQKLSEKQDTGSKIQLQSPPEKDEVSQQKEQTEEIQDNNPTPFDIIGDLIDSYSSIQSKSQKPNQDMLKNASTVTKTPEETKKQFSLDKYAKPTGNKEYDDAKKNYMNYQLNLIKNNQNIQLADMQNNVQWSSEKFTQAWNNGVVLIPVDGETYKQENKETYLSNIKPAEQNIKMPQPALKEEISENIEQETDQQLSQSQPEEEQNSNTEELSKPEISAQTGTKFDYEKFKADSEKYQTDIRTYAAKTTQKQLKFNDWQKKGTDEISQLLAYARNTYIRSVLEKNKEQSKSQETQNNIIAYAQNTWDTNKQEGTIIVPGINDEQMTYMSQEDFLRMKFNEKEQIKQIQIPELVPPNPENYMINEKQDAQIDDQQITEETQEELINEKEQTQDKPQNLNQTIPQIEVKQVNTADKKEIQNKQETPVRIEKKQEIPVETQKKSAFDQKTDIITSAIPKLKNSANGFDLGEITNSFLGLKQEETAPDTSSGTTSVKAETVETQKKSAFDQKTDIITSAIPKLKNSANGFDLGEMTNSFLGLKQEETAPDTAKAMAGDKGKIQEFEKTSKNATEKTTKQNNSIQSAMQTMMQSISNITNTTNNTNIQDDNKIVAAIQELHKTTKLFYSAVIQNKPKVIQTHAQQYSEKPIMSSRRI